MKADLEGTFPTLEHAPITEAVIDLRAELDASVSLDDLARFQIGLEERFGEKIERRSLKAQIELLSEGEPRVSAPKSIPDGFFFRSKTEPTVAQARFDGFTLNRLSPYHNGDQFLSDARQLWRKYVEICKPKKVTRLAVRNINRIDIGRAEDLQAYVLTGPEIARALPQNMARFFMQLALPDSESGAEAVITETVLESNPNSATVPLIFDIEASIMVDVLPSDPQIWATLNLLRTFKNRIFFNSITSRALEAFR